MIRPRAIGMSKLVISQEQTLLGYEFARDRRNRVSTVAARLKEAMEDRGVDQSALAEAIGVTQGTISLILVGKTRHSKYLPDIAIELGVAYDWLVGNHENKHADQPVDRLLTTDEADLVEMRRALPNLDRFAFDRVCKAISRTAENAPREIWLPEERALARMFLGLLKTSKNAKTMDEQALLLAKRLPNALSQLRDLLPDTAPPATPPAERTPVLATPDHEHRQ